MSLLTVVKKACAVCNIAVPSAVISSTDQNIQQMLYLAQMEGDESAASYDWRNLKTKITLAGDGTTTLFQLPSDFDHFMMGVPLISSAYPTIPLPGPISDDDLMRLKALGYAAPVSYWRLIGGAIEVWPAIGAGVTVTGEYRSNCWILASDRLTRLPEFASDDDLPLIPDRVLLLGLIWRWKAAKGLEYAEDFRTWDMERQRASGHDVGNRTISISRANPSAASWPGTITDLTGQ